MIHKKTIIWLALATIAAFLFHWFSFSNEKVFWYFYAFTTLFLASIAFYAGDIKDELKTIPFMLYGLLFGAFSYMLLGLIYKAIEVLPFISTKSIGSFLKIYGPENLWHFILLFIIIVPGEELFWRGFLQKRLKNIVSPAYAIIISAILFGISFIFSGFYLGMIAAAVIGALLGILYEWKKSMPLIIVAHITMLLLFFIIFPIV